MGSVPWQVAGAGRGGAAAHRRAVPRIRLRLLPASHFVSLSLVLAACVRAAAPPASSAPARDPLAAKQEIVRDRMAQLEDRMFRLIEKIAESEPDQAERLRQALRKSRELLVRRHMDEVVRLLDERNLTEASDRQKALVRDLNAILKLLMENTADAEERRKAMESLKAFGERIAKLLEEQRAHQKALQDLQRRGAERWPSESPRLADGQRATAEKAGKLAQDMSGKPDGREDGVQSRPASRPGSTPASRPARDAAPPPAAGQENVEKAQRHMENASRGLEQNRPGDAESEQQKAIDQLEEAKRQLEDTLNQLRREQQEEILRAMEDRFREMLARQLQINQGTVDLDKKGVSRWTRTEELQAGTFSQGERDLAADATRALTILRQEGTTLVFPQIVEQLAADLNDAGERIRSRDVGPATQQLQQDIVQTLNELIEAVQQMRKKIQAGEAPGSPPGGPEQAPPLLPESAELKLLRACQVRINRETEAFNRDLGGEKSLTPEDAKRLKRIADRQKDVARMAEELNERTADR